MRNAFQRANIRARKSLAALRILSDLCVENASMTDHGFERLVRRSLRFGSSVSDFV